MTFLNGDLAGTIKDIFAIIKKFHKLKTVKFN